MTWTISITYDPVHDVVNARYRDVVLKNAEDALRWRREVEAQFRRIGRRADVLISLDGLLVRPAASRAYGEHRAAIIELFCRQTYRYGGDAATRTSVFTSSVLHQVQANVHATREDALRALLADRAAQG